MVYTKTGDSGTTSLVGGKRVSKCDARVEAYGTVDELNSHVGLLAEYAVTIDRMVYDQMKTIQNEDASCEHRRHQEAGEVDRQCGGNSTEAAVVCDGWRQHRRSAGPCGEMCVQEGRAQGGGDGAGEQGGGNDNAVSEQAVGLFVCRFTPTGCGRGENGDV